ncbi:MAG TPA: hypothetical protein VH590_04860, partial [Ktedonobacterales bacterium]
MFRWASIICSSIALALFFITGFAVKVDEGCPDRIPMTALAIARADSLLLSLQPPCVTFYDTLYSSTFLCGFSLTVLLLIANLIMAFRKRTWDWLFTLLVVPPLCFSCGILAYSSWAGGGVYLLQSFSITVGCAFIGLLNLLYGIIGLRPERRAA